MPITTCPHVLANLAGADVEVTLEIHARLQNGASHKTVRDGIENCRTLGFETFGFEEQQQGR